MDSFIELNPTTTVNPYIETFALKYNESLQNKKFDYLK
jgi:hypothetical protein